MAVRLVILNPKLLRRKLIMLVGATIALVPLVHYRWLLPGRLYVGVLLVLHLYLLAVYLWRTDWRQLTMSKTGLAGRAAAVVFFAYLLSVLNLGGTLSQIIWGLMLALVIHGAILLLLMVRLLPESN